MQEGLALSVHPSRQNMWGRTEHYGTGSPIKKKTSLVEYVHVICIYLFSVFTHCWSKKPSLALCENLGKSLVDSC